MSLSLFTANNQETIHKFIIDKFVDCQPRTKNDSGLAQLTCLPCTSDRPFISVPQAAKGGAR